MRQSVSVIDVARQAGVSLGTVSNVLNHPERVAPATLERVHRAIDALGFVRNEAARQLRAGRSRTIGLILLDVGNPFFIDVARGVEQAATEQGLSVVLCNSAGLAERERHYLGMLEEQRAFGVLTTPVQTRSRAVDEIRRRGTPVVLVDRAAARGQCSVSVDDVVGGGLATEHLIARGHRRIAFVGGPVDLDQVADRLAGARNAVRAAGIAAENLTVVATAALTVEAGRLAGEQVLLGRRSARPTAVLCANDLLALGVLQTMTARGVHVPDELAIVGYDDIEFAAAAAIPLTSVRQPRQELGRTATEMLIEEADPVGRHRHRQVVFAPELVARASTDPP